MNIIQRSRTLTKLAVHCKYKLLELSIYYILTQRCLKWVFKYSNWVCYLSILKLLNMSIMHYWEILISGIAYSILNRTDSILQKQDTGPCWSILMEKTTKRYNLTQVPAVRHKQSITDSANPTKHTLLLLFSLPVYMFRFRLLLLFIIVHLIFNPFLAYAFILPCLVAVCQPEIKSWLIDWLNIIVLPVVEYDVGNPDARRWNVHLGVSAVWLLAPRQVRVVPVLQPFTAWCIDRLDKLDRRVKLPLIIRQTQCGRYIARQNWTQQRCNVNTKTRKW